LENDFDCLIFSPIGNGCNAALRHIPTNCRRPGFGIRDSRDGTPQIREKLDMPRQRDIDLPYPPEFMTAEVLARHLCVEPDTVDR
jgi:hypothetical protein